MAQLPAHIAAIVCAGLWACLAHAQSSAPPGIYRNLAQLRAGTPDSGPALRATKRTAGDIAFAGGNDYRLEDPADTTRKKFLKREIYAFSTGDSLFLNGAPHKLQQWYALALSKGNFIAFRGCMDNSEATSYAILGGAIGGAAAAGKRYLYILSLRTGNLRLLTKEYMEARLSELPDHELLTRFTQEPDAAAETTLVRYTQLLNSTLATETPSR